MNKASQYNIHLCNQRTLHLIRLKKAIGVTPVRKLVITF